MKKSPALKPVRTRSAWRHSMGALLLASFLSVPLLSIAASRDDMPPPSRAPRTPVEAEKLPGSIEATFARAATPVGKAAATQAAPTNDIPKEIAGGAVAIDGQTIKLRENGRDMTLRLAGVVAPPITSPEGINARAALDAIVKDQTINCVRRDRDTDGRAIMSCTYNGGKDVAEELLFTGTVLYSRASTLSPELAVRYKAAEETAQSRRAGLWTRVASINVAAAAPAAVPTATSVRPQTQQLAVAPAATTLAVKPATAAPVAAIPAPMPTPNDAGWSLWLKAMGLLGALFGMLAWLDTRHMRRTRYQHELEVRTERQVLAAALTGELAAARDICEARAAQIAGGVGGNRNMKFAWPRLRTYIYQAHVEHIGLLGPVLARQVASIYGQMADYSAATKDEVDSQMTAASMARTLARLCGYIEITLEGLGDVEQSGEPYHPATGMIGAQEASEKHAAQVARKVTQKLPPAGTTSTTPTPPSPKKISPPVAGKVAETPATEAPTAEADMADGFAAPKETRQETRTATASSAPVAEAQDAEKPATPGISADMRGQIPWWKQRQLEQKAATEAAAQSTPKAQPVETASLAADAEPVVTTSVTAKPLPINATKQPVPATATGNPLANARNRSNATLQRQRAMNVLKEETAKLESMDGDRKNNAASPTGIIAPDIPATA